MTKQMLTMLFFSTVTLPMAGQSKLSIQGVWRPLELTVTASAAASRKDPFDAFQKGTHTLQPGVVIFTAKHYSRTTDTAAQPRPTTGDKIPGKPTVEELQARWGPFAANAGTYELSGTTLTLRAVVAKDPRVQRETNFARLTARLEGNTLWLTPVETSDGPIPNPVTARFVRVE